MEIENPKLDKDGMYELMINLAEWGAMSAASMRAKWGSNSILRLRRNDYADLIETNWGKVIILNRRGRLCIGYLNEYYPSMDSIGNHLALREAVRILEESGYCNLVPQDYGRSHPGIISPSGEKHCLVARITGYSQRALRELVGKAQEKDNAKVIFFSPKPSKMERSSLKDSIVYIQFPKDNFLCQNSKSRVLSIA